MALLEKVLGLALLGLVLLFTAAISVQTHRGGQLTRRKNEAVSVAQNLLERRLAGPVLALPLGAQPPVAGKMADSTPYRAVVEVYPLGQADVSNDDIKGLRVTVSWNDQFGPHHVQSESYLARVPR